MDSLSATLGQGLLVYKAVQLKEAGKNLDEIVAWLEENKYHLVHNFTVDDLFHLHRGGRLSKTARNCRYDDQFKTGTSCR